MTPNPQYSRILLAINASGSIAFCESCDVIELEIGSISMRIDAPSLEALSMLLKDADIRLSYYRLEKASFNQTQTADIGFH